MSTNPSAHYAGEATTMKTRLFCTTFAFILCLTATSEARTHKGTVVLDSGERIEKAEYVVKTAFKIVEITKIDHLYTKRKFSFNRIAALIDVNGKDVTKKYLGRFAVRLDSPNPNPSALQAAKNTADVEPTASPEPEDSLASDSTHNTIITADSTKSPTHAIIPSVSKKVQTGLHESEQTSDTDVIKSAPGESWRTRQQRDRTLAPDHLKLWNVGFRIGTNFSAPSGDFYDGITSGIGFGADIIIPVSYNLAIRGTVSRSGMKLDNRFGFTSFDPNLVILSQDNSFNGTRISVTGEYYSYDRRKAFPPKLVGFFYSGLGAIAHSLSSSLTVLDNTTSIVTTSSFSDSFTELIYVLGAGADFMISPTVGFEVTGNFDLVILGKDGADRTQYAYIFDLRFGLVAFF